MDSEQAKLILSRPHTGVPSPKEEELLEQALAMMENDSALAEWFVAHSQMDDAMKGALQTITPPSHLRDAILAGAKVTELPAPRRFSFVWLAAAAAVVLALGLSLFLPQRRHSLSVAQLNAEIPQLTSAHEHSFASGAGDMEQIRSWLAAHGGAENFSIPDRLKNAGPVACEVTSINGAKVSILCFDLGQGRVTHLYIVDRSQLSDPPTPDVPSFVQQGAYAVASWSHAQQSYFLAERGDAEALRRIL